MVVVAPEFSGLGDDRRGFVDWLLTQCLAKGTKPDEVITADARDFLAEKLSTPLQFAEHLNRAFTDAYRMGAATVTREIVEETLSFGFDDLDARLARIGYTPKALAEQFDAGLPEIRRFSRASSTPIGPRDLERPCAVPVCRSDPRSQIMWSHSHAMWFPPPWIVATNVVEK